MNEMHPAPAYDTWPAALTLAERSARRPPADAVRHSAENTLERSAEPSAEPSVEHGLEPWVEHGGDDGDSRSRHDAARRRLERWQSQSPFRRGAHFQQRLALHGLTESTLLAILAEPEEALRQRQVAPPSWVETLRRSFSRSQPAEPAPVPETISPNLAALLHIFEPLLSEARARLRERVAQIATERAHAPFDVVTIVDALYATLPGDVLRLASRTLMLELNVARVEGALAGDTPEARFAHFIERTRQKDDGLGLLREYPVLGRLLATRVEQWLEVSTEIVTHLCADWPRIVEVFNGGRDPGTLIEIAGNISDRHQGGRSVRILRFSSGFRIVYKPKPLAADRHFQELLAWLNDRGATPPFRTLEILDAGRYGWVEYIEAHPCASRDELERFYQRQGGYLALLYAVEATDFHYENLKASGEHPMLLDLEALFHPHVPKQFSKATAESISDARLSYSVLRVGLLPAPFNQGGAAGESWDLSGLGSSAGQVTPFETPICEGAGTDQMRLGKARLPLQPGENQPSIDGAAVDPLAFADAIAAGFERTYRLILAHRDALLARGGPLARFANDVVRVILRATRLYGMMLDESCHPDVLRDALERDRFFDRIWFAVEDLPSLARVIAYEQRDLWAGDIPMFVTRPGSRHLWTSRHACIEDFFERTGLDLARTRIAGMGESDLRQQLWFVRASLATLSTAGHRIERVRLTPHPSSVPLDPARALTAARAIGDQLEALALCGDDDVSWLGLSMGEGMRCRLAPMGPDLYDGLPGVALFLGYLGAIAGVDRYTALADRAMRSALRPLELLGDAERAVPLEIGVGGFSGLGGLIYALTHLGALWHRADFLEQAEKLTFFLPEMIARDEYLDVVAGSAGCSAVLLGLDAVRPSVVTRELANRCGDRLLERAHSPGVGLAWSTRVPARQPLVGFSHGAAGMAWALAGLARATGAPRFARAAHEAMRYERSRFSHEAQNWPDLRETQKRATAVAQGDAGDDEAVFTTAWCHGAAGIGLARARSLAFAADDSEIRREIRYAVETTLLAGFGLNHSLCHGDLGNIELLIEAGRVLEDDRITARADRMAAAIVEDVERGWRCGNPLEVEAPGLMTGLAGIGLGLLRLAERARTPCVLMLDPPPHAIRPDDTGAGTGEQQRRDGKEQRGRRQRSFAEVGGHV